MQSQQIPFIGVLLDSATLTARLSMDRVADFQSLLSLFWAGTTVTYRQCMGLTGTMSSSISLIRLGRFHMRPFQRWMLSLRIYPTQGRRRVVVSDDAISALRPWRPVQFLTQGVPMELVSSRLVITTDASLREWGATFQGRSASGLWEGDLLRAHINFLELMAVQLALSHFLPLIRHQHVLVRTDNLTTMFYINKQGGMRSDRLDGLARSLTLWCVDNLASLRAEYVPGLLNLGADLLSRGQARYDDWSLHPEVAELVWCRFGSPVADLFASEDNTKCPLFFALRGRSTLGNDALEGDWPQDLLYAFPPLRLIQPVLERVRTGGARLLLIAPGWGTWVSVITPLLYDELWTLPLRRDLLRQAGDEIFHERPQDLALRVWPVSASV